MNDDALADSEQRRRKADSDALLCVPGVREALFELFLILGDDSLILGHRLSECCAHAPLLEEDIALSNIALDSLGQAEYWLHVAGTLEGNGRDENALAFFREETAFRNSLLVEQPNGDFADVMMRQLFFDVYYTTFLHDLSTTSFLPLAEGAAKCLKEARYHLRHAAEWCVRLGLGTEESSRRLNRAVHSHVRFLPELFEFADSASVLSRELITPNLHTLRSRCLQQLDELLRMAEVNSPVIPEYAHSLGRKGYHSEHLGHLLAQMQSLARAFPGASW